MKKLPKHLREMEPKNLEMLQKGTSRFRFGFANPGETMEFNGNILTFVGNFSVRKLARQVAEGHGWPRGVTIHPYIYGRLANGWVVWTFKPISTVT